MPRALLLSVRFHDGRYHGVGDWPPAPARLFQALVAGAACGQPLGEKDKEALAWLETLEAPVIAAPKTRECQGFRNYVPNNDLDAVGGDLRRIGKIRAPKLIRPRLFDHTNAFLYAWSFETAAAAENHAREICAMAERLYQLGRGVDMAWAWAEVLDGKEIEPLLARHGGVLFCPAQGGAGEAFLYPIPGSLKSLSDRFEDTRKRFTTTGNKGQHLFTQPRKPRFGVIAYDSPSRQVLYDLRGSTPEAPFVPWPLMKMARLVERLRDAVAERLKSARSEKEALIERVLIGRGATEADKAARVRIVPLPSIGHAHADHAIRLMLVEIPPNCPLPAAD